jgi:hypothetical protein
VHFGASDTYCFSGSIFAKTICETYVKYIPNNLGYMKKSLKKNLRKNPGDFIYNCELTQC